jgi:hypothetical protein
MTYRNRKLLDLARDCPHCMSCRSHNDGSVVAAHSNSQEFGKGMGIKASDAAIAFLCDDCHSLVDGRTGKLDRFERETMFYKASMKTYVWMMEQGKLELK